jgi:predicted dehydrogenase
MTTRVAPSVTLVGDSLLVPLHAMAARAAGVDVVAFAGADQARIAEFVDRLGARAVASSDLPAGADVVLLIGSSPNMLRDARAALAANARVAIAGPLAGSLADADALLALERSVPGRLHWVSNFLYAQVVWAMLTRRAALGPLTYIEVRANDPAAGAGNGRADLAEPHTDARGARADAMSHALALALVLAAPASVISVSATAEAVDAHLATPTSVVSVSATAEAADAHLATPASVISDSARVEAGHAHQAETGCEVTLQFDNGLRAVVAVAADPTAGAWFDAQVSSSTGVLRADIVPTPSLEHNGDPVPIARGRGELQALEDYGFVALHQAMFSQPLTLGYTSSVAFGRLIVAITAASYESAATGVPVSL